MTAKPGASRLRSIALGACLLFAILEIGARRSFSGPLRFLRPSSDPELLYELIPGSYVSDGFLYHVKTSSYEIAADGCRISAAQKDTVVSPDVVLLGGSVAFGLDADFEDALGWRLRQALRQQTGRPVELETCAVPGHRLAQSLRMAAAEATTRQPPVIAIIVMEKHIKTAVDWTRMAPTNPIVDFLTAHVRSARVAYMFGYVHWYQGERMEAASHEQSQRSLTQSMDQLADATRGTPTRIVFFLEDKVKHSAIDVDRELAARGFESCRFQHLPEFELAADLWADRTHWSGRGADAIMLQLVDHIRAALPPNGALPRR